MTQLPDNAPVLRFSYRGAPQTVATMKHAAIASQQHYKVRLLAEQICAGLPSKDYLSEYLALFNFCLPPQIRYMRDPRTIELVRAPHIIVDQILRGHVPSADCDDLSAFLAAMIMQVGGEVRFVTVAFQKMFYRGMPQYSHVFMEAKEPRTGTWVTLDPVAGPSRTREMLNRVVAAAYWPVA